MATTYEASIAGVTSRTLMVGVQPALSLRVLAGGGVRGHVAAGTSFKGRLVQLQRRMRSGGWSTFARRPLNRFSTTNFPSSLLPSGGLRLRLAMSVNAAGPGYLGSFSPLLAYPAHAVSLSMSAFKVVYGKSFNLTGRISATKPGLGVAILARPFMQTEAQQVATIRTGTSGSWSYRVTPPFTTSYQVRFGNATSRTLTIGVRPAMSVRMLSGDRVWAPRWPDAAHDGPVAAGAGADGKGRVEDGQQAAARPEGVGDLHTVDAACRNLDAAHGDQRQPGRRRVPRRFQQAVRLPPLGPYDR